MPKNHPNTADGVVRMGHLSSPWIEDFVVRSLTEDSVKALSHVVQVTQKSDAHLQTFLSDGTHMVLTKLMHVVQPGFYRITDYEIIVDDASDTSGWNRLMKSSAVFPHVKFAIYLSVKILTRVGELLEDTVIGDPQILINSVAIRRVLSLPRGKLQSMCTIDAVVAGAQSHQPVPLGNVAEALASEELLAAIQQSVEPLSSDDDDSMERTPSPQKKTRTSLAPSTRVTNVMEEVDTEAIMKTPKETTVEDVDVDMGIDAMMVDEEAEELRGSQETRVERQVEDGGSDATPRIQNWGHPPPRRANHGGETIRVWMTADSPVATPVRKPAFGKDALKYAGDSIRAWLLSSDFQDDAGI